MNLHPVKNPVGLGEMLYVIMTKEFSFQGSETF